MDTKIPGGKVYDFIFIHIFEFILIFRMLSDSERQQQEINCFNALKTLKYLLSSNWFRVNMEKLQVILPTYVSNV